MPAPSHENNFSPAERQSGVEKRKSTPPPERVSKPPRSSRTSQLAETDAVEAAANQIRLHQIGDLAKHRNEFERAEKEANKAAEAFMEKYGYHPVAVVSGIEKPSLLKRFAWFTSGKLKEFDTALTSWKKKSEAADALREDVEQAERLALEQRTKEARSKTQTARPESSPPSLNTLERWKESAREAREEADIFSESFHGTFGHYPETIQSDVLSASNLRALKKKPGFEQAFAKWKAKDEIASKLENQASVYGEATDESLPPTKILPDLPLVAHELWPTNSEKEVWGEESAIRRERRDKQVQAATLKRRAKIEESVLSDSKNLTEKKLAEKAFFQEELTENTWKELEEADEAVRREIDASNAEFEAKKTKKRGTTKPSKPEAYKNTEDIPVEYEPMEVSETQTSPSQPVAEPTLKSTQDTFVEVDIPVEHDLTEFNEAQAQLYEDAKLFKPSIRSWEISQREMRDELFQIRKTFQKINKELKRALAEEQRRAAEGERVRHEAPLKIVDQFESALAFLKASEKNLSTQLKPMHDYAMELVPEIQHLIAEFPYVETYQSRHTIIPKAPAALERVTSLEHHENIAIFSHEATLKAEQNMENGDSLLRDEEHHLYGVFDGMDGIRDASELAQKVFQAATPKLPKIPTSKNMTEWMKKTFVEAHAKLVQEFGRRREKPTTTATVMRIWKSPDGQRHLTIGHLGHSSAYIRRADGTVLKLTHNHDYLAQVVDENERERFREVYDNAKTKQNLKDGLKGLKPDTVEMIKLALRNRNAPTHALGDEATWDENAIEIITQDLKPGDQVFLFTHGVNSLTRDELIKILHHQDEELEDTTISVDLANQVPKDDHARLILSNDARRVVAAAAARNRQDYDQDKRFRVTKSQDMSAIDVTISAPEKEENKKTAKRGSKRPSQPMAEAA